MKRAPEPYPSDLEDRARELAESWINGNRNDVVSELTQCRANGGPPHRADLAALVVRLVRHLPKGDLGTLLVLLDLRRG